MNIFILDTNIDTCASYHVTKHVGKMQLELSQLLCTALHINGALRDSLGVAMQDIPYKKTHDNHPCAVFARANLTNYTYVAGLLCALDKEYQRRYNKRHLSFVKMEAVGVTSEQLYERALKLDVLELAPPTCMPDEYVAGNVVASYRRYYREGKVHLHDWKHSAKPDWI